MRAVVQRVSRASVRVDSEVVGAIDAGLCVLVGVGREDTEHDATRLAGKVVGLRIFEDDEGLMNHDLNQQAGALLAISQFTLLGDARKGKRPSFGAAMEPDAARRLFQSFCDAAAALGPRVETGRFRATMQVEIVNEGPVTMLLDSKKTF